MLSIRESSRDSIVDTETLKGSLFYALARGKIIGSHMVSQAGIARSGGSISINCELQN